MIRGLYTSGIGMKTETKRLDVISNNLANVNTTGYKKDDTIISGFPEVLVSKINDRKTNDLSPVRTMGRASLGAQIDEIYTDFSQGAYERTEDPLHLAIQGNGFFTIQPEGTNDLRYTRDGSFMLDQDANLRTNDGSFVMGQNGPINLGQDFLSSSKEIAVSSGGQIMIEGQAVDTFNMASFEDLTSMRKIGDNEYTSTDQPGQFNGSLVQGFVESSNVNPVEAMVDMITVSRAYEASQKVIQAHDTLLGKAVNEVGRV